MKNSHNPDLVILTKTRLSDDRANSVISNLGYDGFFKVDAMGFSRGIWILWNLIAIVVEPVSASFHEVFLKVQVRNQTFILTALYTSPLFALRKQTWLNLYELFDLITMPWIIMEDFNEISQTW